MTIGRMSVNVLHLQNDLYCVGWGVKLYSLTHVYKCGPILRWNFACLKLRKLTDANKSCIH